VTCPLLEPCFATCPRCPWEQAFETQAEADRKAAVHAERSHGIKTPIEPRLLTGLAWQDAAIDAVRAVAARGEKFTLHDALTEFGIADTPNARTAHGRLAQLCHDTGICHPTGWATSSRPGTKKSALRVWSQSAAGCEECKRKRSA
jgi:predicted small metal-binding protein